MTDAPPILGVVGPTASGKTELALALAQRLPVEILVADSRQAVRGMDVGTAKPDPAARAAVPHHLLDLVDPDEPFSVALWVDAARASVADVVARGRLPMLVGGTGLYVEALLHGHDYAAQAWSPEVRAALVERLEVDGPRPTRARARRARPGDRHAHRPQQPAPRAAGAGTGARRGRDTPGRSVGRSRCAGRAQSPARGAGPAHRRAGALAVRARWPAGRGPRRCSLRVMGRTSGR